MRTPSVVCGCRFFCGLAPDFLDEHFGAEARIEPGYDPLAPGSRDSPGKFGILSASLEVAFASETVNPASLGPVLAQAFHAHLEQSI